MTTDNCRHWHYKQTAWRRLMKKELFTEADALRLRPDAERIEGTNVVATESLRAGKQCIVVRPTPIAAPKKAQASGG